MRGSKQVKGTMTTRAMATATPFDVLLFAATAALAVRWSAAKSSGTFDADTLIERLKSGTTLDATELVCTVDSNNIPTKCGALRKDVRLNNMWHRATYIIIRHDCSEEVTGSSESDADALHILVQKRSMQKDYCPGKLDPAPGGVVGLGEDCDKNARREIQEEMGIDVSCPNSPHTIRKLFTFPYEDDRVRCWGYLYEVQYSGELGDILCQEEEVDGVLRMSLAEIEKKVKDAPGKWMPDGLHALKLYLQHRQDRKVGRRLLHGYSSGNLEAYGLRPKPEAIFFDCDDCLYFDNWEVARHLTEKIEEWCVKHAGLPGGAAYQLYKKHGTALRGLLAEGHMEHCDKAIDQYLKDVHDLPIHDLLEPDKELQKMLENMDPTIPKFVFTASARHHAERCLQALGVHGYFEDIIDVRSVGLVTKHSDEAFRAAMKIAGVKDPEACVFLDDSIKNIEAARRIGWRSVLVGKVGRDCGKPISTEHSEHEIDRIHQLPEVHPELFSS